jgi:serine/threonine protein kinase
MNLGRGSVLGKGYRLVAPLGSGGMGSVWEATRIANGQTVALKVLLKNSSASDTSMERFRREAQAARAIQSPYIARLLDMDEDPELGVILVFERLEGESLVQRLKRSGPIPFDELWGLVEAIWLGLIDAHAAQIVHRDLKPSNVFLNASQEGLQVKILDFGISKLPKVLTEESLTRDGQSLGTFAFMPPEQMSQAREADERADVYACATLIFQALSGHLPYASKNLVRLMQMKRSTRARPLADVVPTAVPQPLEDFLAKGLEREPTARFQSATEALRAWRELKPTGVSLPPTTSSRRIQDSAVEQAAQADDLQQLPGDAAEIEPATMVLRRAERRPREIAGEKLPTNEPQTTVHVKTAQLDSNTGNLDAMELAPSEPPTQFQLRSAQATKSQATKSQATKSQATESLDEPTAVWQRQASLSKGKLPPSDGSNSPTARTWGKARWARMLLFIALGYAATRTVIHLLH